MSPSQEEAMADFASRWRLWLESAGLREISLTSECGCRESHDGLVQIRTADRNALQ
jgi:hypothetical protein